MPQPFHSVRIVGVQERGLSPVSSCLCAAPQAKVNLAPPCEQGGEVVGPSPPPPPPPPSQLRRPVAGRLAPPSRAGVPRPILGEPPPPGRQSPAEGPASGDPTRPAPG